MKKKKNYLIIIGNNYIQSGTVDTSANLGNTFDRDFTNITVGGRNMLILDENGSSSRILAGTNSNPSVIEAKTFYVSPTYGSTFGYTKITSDHATAMQLICGDADNAYQVYLKENGGGANDYMAVPTLSKVFLDGGNNTYIQESSADHISMVAGGVTTFVLDNTSAIIGANQYMTLTDNEIDVSSGDLTLDVAGDIIADVAGGQFTIQDNTNGNPHLIIKCTASNAVPDLGGSILFEKNKDGTGADAEDGDLLGSLIFQGYNDAGTPEQLNYVAFLVQSTDVTEDSEEGYFVIQIRSKDASGSALTTGLYLNGTDTNNRVDVGLGHDATSTTTVAGQLIVEGNHIEMNGNGTIESPGHLSLNVASTKDIYLTENSGTYTPTAANHAVPKHYVDAKRFSVNTNNNGRRMGLLNNWYVSNQSLGTTATPGDWATSKFNYASYNSTSTCTLKSWRWVGEFSSSTDYELELWDVTVPANGTASASTAAKVGDTQSISATAAAIYTLGQTDLSFALAAGHQLYVLVRYTSGSGNKYTYESITMEFELA